MKEGNEGKQQTPHKCIIFFPWQKGHNENKTKLNRVMQGFH